MKKILLTVAMTFMAMGGYAETEDTYVGWPANYGGVMLQGFWWDSYEATKWSNLTDRADELSQYFDLIWVPNSGTVNSDPSATTQSNSMGYDPCYWLSHNSCFGTEDELRTMISTYKDKGVGIIEDVVINHKKGVSDWCDFAQESYTNSTTGASYTISWDNTNYSEICCTDDCNSQGYTTHGGYDTGDDFPGFRDLDHTSTTTQNNVKAYLDFLKTEMGYAGFRYDMVKGYGADYINTYNNHAQPTYSVGEYWDNQTNIQNWIAGTAYASAAFDFPLKWKLNSAISGGDYSAFENKSFTYDPNFSRYSVTFVDNHDTGRESQYKLHNNWSAANAFILASPGTPCVWLTHYEADPINIGAMILARKACGITNTNCYIVQQYSTDSNGGYVLESQGTEGKVYVQFGAATSQEAPSGYSLVASGDAYKFYSTVYNFARVDVSPNGGAFTTATQQVTLTPVNAKTSTWYKIGSEGSQSTLSGETSITIGEGVDVNTDITIYWGATGADNVEYTGSTTFTKRNAYAPSVENNEVCVFLETDAEEVYIWAWDDNTNTNYTGGNWDTKPQMTLMGVNDEGKLIHKWVCTSPPGTPAKVLFVADGNQTSDFTFVNHGYYTESGLSYHLGTNTVYFDNSVSNWSNVYYYAFDSNKNAKAEWPGEQLSQNSEGKYPVTLDGVYTTIIFNDGTTGVKGINQTQDLTVVDGQTYALGTNTVSYNNTNTNWSKVYYYAYVDENTSNADWPGVEITTSTDNVYSATLLEGYTYVIFNDGTSDGAAVGINKTDDLSVIDGMEYTIGANTVTYDNTNTQWSKVYYYTYTANETPKAAWPGEVITPNSEGKYVVTLPEVFSTVIFNDGTGGVVGVSQTANLTAEDGQTYAIEANTVYFDNSSNWTSVYYYAYTDNEVWKTAWPGEALTANADGYYEVTLLEGYSNVIFNNGNSGSGNQTADLTVVDGKIYSLSAGANTQSGYTVYFDNTNSNWGSVYFYAWNDDAKLADWPGQLLSVSDGYYMVHVDDASYSNIIFNNGSGGYGNQTADLTAIDGRVYTSSGLTTNLVLTDGYSYYNESEFTAATAKYSRAMSNNWGTILMPFEITRDDDVQYFELSEVGTETITFEPVESVPAGQPAVFKLVNGPGTLSINVSNVAVVPTADDNKCGTDVASWYINGTYKKQADLNPATGQYLYFIASDQFWQGSDDGTDIPAYRAWLTTTTDLSANQAPFRIVIDDGTEGINVIEQEDGTVKVCYDLQGRRILKDHKGLVIENGKVMFIK